MGPHPSSCYHIYGSVKLSLAGREVQLHFMLNIGTRWR
jgi:hypothetical protein